MRKLKLLFTLVKKYCVNIDDACFKCPFSFNRDGKYAACCFGNCPDEMHFKRIKKVLKKYDKQKTR